MVTSASKLVMAWFLEQQGLDDEDAGLFIDQVVEGASFQDQEAIRIHEGLLLQAKKAADGHPMKEFIDRLLALHSELVSVADEKQKINALERVREIVNKTPDNAFAKRIASHKVLEELDKSLLAA